jgi:potassium efflux system protein
MNPKELHLNPIAILLAGIFVFSGPAHAQSKASRAKGRENAKTENSGKTHIEYSLDTIVQRLDNMHLTLNRINDFQGHGFDTRKVESQLPVIRNNLNMISANLSLNNTVPEIKNLQLFGVMLNDIKDQLEAWRASLFKYNNDLINMNAEIGSFTRDSVIRQLVHDSLFRKMYTDELKELEQKWVAARQSTESNLARINGLQTGVSQEYFETIDLENKVEQLKRELTGRLFTKEYNYIWEPADSSGQAANTGELASKSFLGQRGIMAYFIGQNWSDYLYVLAIGMAFFFWVWYSFRVLRQQPDLQTGARLEDLHLRYLHRLPVLSTLVVMLNIIPFFDLDAPALYTQLIQFFLLIVLSILFWRRWPTRYFLYWIGIAVLFILFSATGAVLVPLMNVRVWLLLLNMVSATLGFIAIKRIIEHFNFSRVVRIVSVVYLVLNILAILANLSGRLSLAKIFSSSAIFGLVQIIGLSVFIDSLLEVLALQATVVKARNAETKPAQINQSSVIFDKMQKGVFNGLTAFSIFTWLIVFAINLNIYDPVYLKLSEILNASKTFGSISFRLGNVFIFILIIYLSNKLQKYVGYLFGATDEHAMPQSGKKGSRLVMTRLILVICGFLLAIAASGLPIDKITIVLGALGVGIGLGLQTIVNNLVSGIILIFERPFQIGDYIELNGKKGIVRDIGIRSSRMVTEEGTEIIMPNGDLLAGEVINWTVKNNQVRIEVPVTVEAGHSFDEIDQIVQEVLGEHKDLSGENKPRVLLNTATEKTMSLTVLVWVANISQIQTIKSEVLSILYQKLKEKGIKTL